MITFEEACDTVLEVFEKEWRTASDVMRTERLEKEKKAIMGYREEMQEYKAKIGRIVEEKGLSEVPYPEWYKNITEGIFNELYGLAGLAPWAYDEKEEVKEESVASKIKNRLDEVDINKLTPLEALNLLYELKEMS